MRLLARPIIAFFLIVLASGSLVAQAGPAHFGLEAMDHVVEPGDTWFALSWRYGISEESLRMSNPHPNRQRQPVIGQVVDIPTPTMPVRLGEVVAKADGGLLQTASGVVTSPWQLAILNGLRSPYRPLLYRPIFVPIGLESPKQYPPGVGSLELSSQLAHPGEALALRGTFNAAAPMSVRFAGAEFNVFHAAPHFVALGGTGAFFAPGQYALDIQIDDEPLWTQPWGVAPGQWTFEQITYTGAAATIDAEAIRQERERLSAIWSQTTSWPHWSEPFALPVVDYLEFSSLYGARRSYSGGPYDRYHEGLDFSAYGGTSVFSPAAGRVSLAEELVARGGAVIIDHGLGVYSGYYHLSEVVAEPGQEVQAGDLIGRVGSTGLSTGNHLHWDFLVNGRWVDPQAWLQKDMACWILAGLGSPCSNSQAGN